jgi:hypothetical protein
MFRHKKAICLSAMALSFPLLALGVAKPAKAAEPVCISLKYTAKVCIEKKGEGIEMYSKIFGITSTKRYMGLDGVNLPFGFSEGPFGTKAEAMMSAKRDPLRIEGLAEACFRGNCTKRNIVFNLNSDGTPISASDAADPNVKGQYQLHWDGQQVGFEPSWTRAQAMQNLEFNKKTYPDKFVEGFFNGRKLGYELYWDGKRVGLEPSWTRAQAIRNLEFNKKAYANDMKVEGFLNGDAIGYELFWDGKRAGFEPGWNRDQAIRNLEFNKKTYPNKKVEGFLDGQKVGYELYFDGERVGFEPGWNRDQALRNLRGNIQRYPNIKVEAILNGTALTP